MEKIICPHCKYINFFEKKKINKYSQEKKLTCNNCNSELIIKKRKKFPFLMIFLLGFFLVIILSLGFFNFDADYDKEYIYEPYFEIREINKSIAIEKIICENRSYRFSTFGGNVITIGNNVFPNLQITNLEEQWGLFKVNFTYINESRFPFNVYGGENLKRALEEKKISINDGDFYSQNYDIIIGPHETILVDKPTQKIDKSTNYWAIGKIVEPKIEECRKKTEYLVVTENKTFIEQRKKEIIIKKKVYEIFFDYFISPILKNLWELAIIILLFCVIVWLFFRIKNKSEIKNNKGRIKEKDE